MSDFLKEGWTGIVKVEAPVLPADGAFKVSQRGGMGVRLIAQSKVPDIIRKTVMESETKIKFYQARVKHQQYIIMSMEEGQQW